MSDYSGKNVKVKLNSSGKKRLKCKSDTLTGKVLPKVDWHIGCPVFSCDIGMLGVGYECDVIEIID